MEGERTFYRFPCRDYGAFIDVSKSQCYNIFEYPHTMEKQHQLSKQCISVSSSKSLQGYFRFRQGMMSILEQRQRSCQNIVELWNKLPQGERAALNQRHQQQTINYKEMLQSWNKCKQILLQAQNGGVEQPSSAVVLGPVEHLAQENAPFGEKEKAASGPKKKKIKKNSQVYQPIRNCK